LDFFTVNRDEFFYCARINLAHKAKNHGISEEIINNAVEAGKQFFSLPSDEKAEVGSSTLDVFN
jgi:hypothetical protein